MIHLKKSLSNLDKTIRSLPGYLLLITLLSSCVGPYMLQHTLKDYKIPLDYTFDSKIDTLKSDKKIYLKIIDNLNINDTTKVKDNGFLLVPLVIAGGYKGDFTVTLGERNIQPSFAEFISHAFKTEANRSGNFIIAKRTFRSDYILEMTLLECQISAQYHKDRIRYGILSNENWILKPITGKFVIEVQLLENREVVFYKKYSCDTSSQLETQRFNSGSSMNLKMMEDFAKTASLEIKEILEMVVGDVNKQLK